MLLQITHETHYDYVPPVELAQHICHLTPICNANQTLHSHSATISPEPDEQTQSIDIFGNARQFFSRRLSGPAGRTARYEPLRVCSSVRASGAYGEFGWSSTNWVSAFLASALSPFS